MTFHALKQSLQNLDRDDVLDAIGLQSRGSAIEKALQAVALLGAGVLVGVGVGLVLAPKPGRELRDDLRLRLRRAIPNGHDLAAPMDGARPG